MNKPATPTTFDKLNHTRTSALLNVGARVATLVAFVVIEGMGGPKLPPISAD